MSILSIQSHVSAGYVGNSVAVPALQGLGRAVWPVHTVLFSNHTGHGRWRGRKVPAALVSECVLGMAELPAVWAERQAVLSGYLGEVDTVQAVADAVDLARRGRPELPYLLDPVIGDVGCGRYVDDAIPAAMWEALLPRATLAAPNLFELRDLTGLPCADLRGVLTGAEVLRRQGPRVVVVTSMDVPDGPRPADARCLIADDSGAWVVGTPRLTFACPLSGTGDLVSALLLHAWLDDPTPPTALSRSVSAAFAVLEETARRGTAELALLAARDSMARPARLWPAEAV